MSILNKLTLELVESGDISVLEAENFLASLNQGQTVNCTFIRSRLIKFIKQTAAGLQSPILSKESCYAHSIFGGPKMADNFSDIFQPYQ